MSKDGTTRAGARHNKGGGQKKPAIPDLTVIRIAENNDKSDKNYPKCDPFLNEKQICGVPLSAKKVYDAMAAWLSAHGCNAVQPKLIEEYALAYARWRQAEKLISQKGLLAPHPTTGVDMASPLVTVSAGYFKQMHAAWYAIWDVMRRTGGEAESLDEMEELLKNSG